MRIWFLTGASVTPTTQRMAELATELGHEPTLVDHVPVLVRHAADGLTLAGAPTDRPDLVINRMRGDERHLRHATRLQTALESRGVPTANRAAAVAVAAVKSAWAGRVAAAGLPQPLTVVATVDSSADAIADQTGLPVVIKADRGLGGLATHRVTDRAALREILAVLRDDGVREVVAQPFLEDVTEVLRVVVLEGEVIAAIVRRPTAEEWRATSPLGATVVGSNLERHEAALALAVAAACDLEVAGIDLLRRGGPGANSTEVVDVEASPELRLTEAAHREDLTRRILTRLVAAARAGRLGR